MAGFENGVVVAKNLNFDEVAAKPHLGIINAAGKFPIGTGNTSPTPEILGGTITSPGGSITVGYVSPNITLDVAAGSGIQQIDGDTGSVTGSTINLLGNVSAGNTVSFDGSASTMTLNVTDSARVNTFIGLNAGNSTTTGGNNIAIGGDPVAAAAPLASLSTGQFNIAIGGDGTGAFITSGSDNVIIGSSSFFLSNGTNNTIIGSRSSTDDGGSYNLFLGAHSASAYNSEGASSNILLMNAGITGDNNTIRIGTQGTGNGQQNKCFVAGVTGTTSTGTNVIVSSSGQLTAGGIGTNTSQPAFLAYNSSNVANATGDGTSVNISLDSEVFDQGGNFATSTYTSPVNGKVLLCYTLGLFNLTALHTEVIFYVIVNAVSYEVERCNPGVIRSGSSNQITISGSLIVSMNAGQTAFLQCVVSGSTKTVGITGSLAGGVKFSGGIFC